MVPDSVRGRSAIGVRVSVHPERLPQVRTSVANPAATSHRDAIGLNTAARNRSSPGSEAELLRDQNELQGDGLNGAVSFISLLPTHAACGNNTPQAVELGG